MKTKTFIAFLVISLLLIPNVFASDNVLIDNDFEETSWTVKEGYAIFKSSSIQLLPSASSKIAHIQYATTLDQLNNATYPSALYFRIHYNATFISGLGEYASIQVFLTNSTGTKTIALSVNEDPSHNNDVMFRVITTECDQNTTLSTKYAPKDFIVFFNGYWAILYDNNGDVLASIELSQGVTNELKLFAIKTYGYETTTIEDYKVCLTLEAATKTSVEGIVNIWIPTIVALAMLSACLGMVKKFVR